METCTTCGLSDKHLNETNHELRNNQLASVNKECCPQCKKRKNIAEKIFHLLSKEHWIKTRTTFCSLCDKIVRINNKSGHTNPDFHKRRERFAVTVEKTEIDNPEADQIWKILTDATKDSRVKKIPYFWVWMWIWCKNWTKDN